MDSFIVDLSDGTQKIVEGIDFAIDDTRLLILDKNRTASAVFEAGVWQSITKNEQIDVQFTPANLMDCETGESVRAMMINGGLDGKERYAASYLAKAWNNFIEIEDMPDYLKREFADGWHKCQSVLGQRVLRRLFPDYWR